MTKIANVSIAEMIRLSAPSKLINCWRVKFGKKYYAITPAHVAIYPKNKIWTKSPFLRELNHLEWKMPSNYHLTQSLTEDFAWAEISKPGEHYLDHIEDIITDPVNVNFYFRQPYDIEGKLQEESSFAALNATLFQSPKSKLVEALDVGFRGMSGAIAIGELGKFYGILVRRGAVQDIKDPIPRIVNEYMEDENLEMILKLSRDFFRSDLIIKTCDTIVNPQVDSDSKSRILKMLEILIEKNDENFQRLDNNFQKMEENLQRIERKINVLQNMIGDLDNSVIKKNHLNQLLTIVGLRRAIVIPWNRMSQLISKQPSVYLDKIVGLEHQQKDKDF